MRELISMVDFVLEINDMSEHDFLRYINFKGEYGANKNVEILAIKNKLYYEYAKFLNKELTIDMFEGDNKIFEGGKYNNKSTINNYYSINDFTIFMDDEDGKINCSIGLTVQDLVGLRGLEYSYQLL